MIDLRGSAHEDALVRVERAFDVRLCREGAVRKRRSIGLQTDRNTWVRIEARPVDRLLDGQGWNGAEAAAVLTGVSRPAWYQGMSWSAGELMWRADETTLVTDQPVKPGGVLTADPGLSDDWWKTLAGSLAALAAVPAARWATPTMQPLTQARVAVEIGRAYPDLDSTVTEWTTAHGDLFWSNLTAPACTLLDWEDWGRAPRGWDAACLWHCSLAVPALAERVYQELCTELDTRSGLLCQLQRCVETITAPTHLTASDMLYLPSVTHTDRIVGQLTKPA